MVIILGLGFTGQRLARRLRAAGQAVFAPVRGVDRFKEMESIGVDLAEWDRTFPATGEGNTILPANAKIAWLVPPIAEPGRAALRKGISNARPSRIVYVSSTGVFGNASVVDERSSAEATDERGRVRLQDEEWIGSGSWSALILRAAAIYGPGRGAHTALMEGRAPRGSGGGLVSRVHVDDLVALIEAGLDSNLTGTWPVADDEPCSTDEIIRWCAGFLQLPASVEGTNSGNSIAGRSVNGAKIRERLGVSLRYPSWRTGVPACLEEESAGTEA